MVPGVLAHLLLAWLVWPRLKKTQNTLDQLLAKAVLLGFFYAPSYAWGGHGTVFVPLIFGLFAIRYDGSIGMVTMLGICMGSWLITGLLAWVFLFCWQAIKEGSQR